MEFIHTHFKSFTLLIFLLSALLLLLPVTRSLAQAQHQKEKINVDFITNQAENDAYADTHTTLYGFGGFCCGVFAWLFVLMGDPDVPSERLIGKSADYVVIYSMAYKEKVKSMRTDAVLIGWALGLAASIITYLVVPAFDTKSGE